MCASCVLRLPVYNIAGCDNDAATRDRGRPKSESASKGIVMCAPPPAGTSAIVALFANHLFLSRLFPRGHSLMTLCFSFHPPILVPPADCLSKLFSRFYWSEQPNDNPPPPLNQDSPSLKHRSTKCVFFLQQKQLFQNLLNFKW